MNTSPTTPCWRLVHDGKKVLALFESSGETKTINTMFCGTKEACDAEISRLGLTPLPPEPDRRKR